MYRTNSEESIDDLKKKINRLEKVNWSQRREIGLLQRAFGLKAFALVVVVGLWYLHFLTLQDLYIQRSRADLFKLADDMAKAEQALQQEKCYKDFP